MRDRRQWDDWLHRSVTVKIRANYNEHPLRVYFGKWEQKGTVRQKFASRLHTLTWHSMRRAWLFDCFRYKCWWKTSWRYALNRSLNVEISVPLLLNFAFCIRLPVLFFDHVCACVVFKIYVHRIKSYIFSYIASVILHGVPVFHAWHSLFL